MGIKGASSILWKATNISWKDLKVIADSHWFCDSNNKYCADVDCNWVAFYLAHNKNEREAARTVCQFLLSLANIGFKVTPICDGNVWDHSKRDSTRRVTERRKGIIDEFALRQTMLTISEEIDAVVEAERTTDELQKRKDDVLLKYKKLGRKRILKISPEFSDMLTKELAGANAIK